MMKLKKICIQVNRGKTGVFKLEEKILELLSKDDVSVYSLDDFLHNKEKPDAIFVLGGDGTVLSTLAIVAEYEIPILGINIGKLGFLTELIPQELDDALPQIINGDFEIHSRMMLKCEFDGKKQNALNEITVDKGASPRGLNITTVVSNSPLGCYFADGLIISTPTGSTAYSMSAGGSIVSPNLDAILITPICPYTLSIRPVVVGSEEVIKISLKCSKDETANLTVDGQIRFPVTSGSEITVSKYEKRAYFISYYRRSFYEILRKKLGWGTPPGEEKK